MWPVLGSIVGGLISGGASLLGGQQSNAANAQQALMQDQFNAMMQVQQQSYNAQQAGLTRDWTSGQMDKAMSFDAAQAANQMAFQDTEMQKAMAFTGGSMDKAMAFNSAQAQTQRDYETQMSNTAYQRAVAGMKAAGLNPILSAGTGGASTPSVGSASISPVSVGVPGGAMASIGTPSGATASSGLLGGTSARMADVFSPAVSSAAQGASLAMSVAKGMADIQNVNADTANKLAGPSGVIPAITKIANTVTGGDAVGKAAEIIKSVLPPPGPTAAKQVGDAVTKLTGQPSNTDPETGAPLNIPALKSGALGDALWNYFRSIISPGGTSFSPGNPGAGVAPVSPQAASSAAAAARAKADGLTGPDLYDWAIAHRLGSTLQ